DRAEDCERIIELIMGSKLRRERRVLAWNGIGDIGWFQPLKVKAHAADQGQTLIPDEFILREHARLEVGALWVRTRGGTLGAPFLICGLRADRQIVLKTFTDIVERVLNVELVRLVAEHPIQRRDGC